MAALDEMRVKIGADLSGLYKGAADASKILSEVGASAAEITPSFSKSAAAADALETSLSSLAAKGNANIKAIADRALGISPIMTNLSKNVAAFGGGVISNKVPEYFKKVEIEATKASAAVGSNVKAGSDKAAFALQNLGRIAQDAPFGFIGIQNNINPLLESFQRLKAETGSTAGAFKAMASGLTGAGGLGLAVSIATSVLTVLAINGFFKTEKAAENAKKANEEFRNSIKSIISDLSKEATNVSSLVSALQSDTLARQQKVTALKELQSIAPDYFGNLKLEKGYVNNLTEAYGAYLSALKERFKVKSLDSELDKLFDKKLNLEIKLDSSANTFLSKDTSDRITRFEGQIEALGGRKILEGADFTKLTDAQKKVETLSNAIITLQSKTKIERIGDTAATAELNTVNKQIDGLLARRSQIANFDIKFTKDPKEKAHIKDVDDVLQQLNSDLELNKRLAGIGFISSAEEDTNKINKVKAAIEELLKLPKGRALNPDDSIISNLIGSIQPEEVRAQLTERMKVLSKELSTVSQTDLFKASDGKPITIPANVHITTNIKAALANLNKEFTDEFNKSAKEIQKSVINSGFSSLGDTIGAALGGGNVAGAFEGLLQTVINGMKQLGEAMIGLGTAKIALEKFNLAPGIGTVLAGVGIIALSSAIQAALPKFAGGVTGFGGGLALVGERGPEMVRLPQGSDVIPNHRLNGIAGGGPQVIIPDVVLRGDHLLLLFNRATQQQNRRG